MWQANKLPLIKGMSMNEDSARYVMYSKEKKWMDPERCYYKRGVNFWVTLAEATRCTKEESLDPKLNIFSDWKWIKVKN